MALMDTHNRVTDTVIQPVHPTTTGPHTTITDDPMLTPITSPGQVVLAGTIHPRVASYIHWLYNEAKITRPNYSSPPLPQRTLSNWVSHCATPYGQHNGIQSTGVQWRHTPPQQLRHTCSPSTAPKLNIRWHKKHCGTGKRALTAF